MKPRLTDSDYWDKVWTQGEAPAAAESKWQKLLRETPEGRQLWTEILPKFVPPAPARVIEIGSAPGQNLLQFRRHFGYDIVGVDFSPEGLRNQRELFARSGVKDEGSSLLGDFLDTSFQERFRDHFDVVYSAGLIEHFSDPGEAVRAHARILKPGGLLIISIPNLTGIYRHFVPKEILDVHNLTIMNLESFRSLFQIPGINLLFCELHGQLNLGLAYVQDSFLCRSLIKLQSLANLLAHAISIPENRMTSPHLLFIGQKREA